MVIFVKMTPQFMPSSSHFSQLSQSIVKTLLYFDLFSYPLKAQEVYQHLQSNHVSEPEVAKELQRLSHEKVLFQSGEFYGMQRLDTLVDRRIAGNKKAQEYMRIARRRSLLIYQFPFVRAVMISGSLSKNYADDSTDIDFFVITAPGRLWVARTFLVLFKRIFLLNSHKYFCVNYFVDEAHLEIDEKNLFTATELSTLLPLRGFGAYQQLIRSNPWVQQILPNSHGKLSKAIDGMDRNSWLKQSLEWMFASRIGDRLEKWFMQLSQSRWRRLYAGKLSPADFEVAFKSKEHVSKNHPENYQRKVMDRYRRKLEEFALLHTWKWVYD